MDELQTYQNTGVALRIASALDQLSNLFYGIGLDAFQAGHYDLHVACCDGADLSAATATRIRFHTMREISH